jgi:hypothetical protein
MDDRHYLNIFYFLRIHHVYIINFLPEFETIHIYFSGAFNAIPILKIFN